MGYVRDSELENSLAGARTARSVKSVLARSPGVEYRQRGSRSSAKRQHELTIKTIELSLTRQVHLLASGYRLRVLTFVAWHGSTAYPVMRIELRIREKSRRVGRH